MAGSRDAAQMRLAIDQAHNAALVGEVPVGAVVFRQGPEGPQVIATGYNRPITDHDPTAHAEIVALRHAAQLMGNYRLPECEVFVTLEPCPMCAMALLHARVRRVVFGASDPKGGGAGSVIDVFGTPALNHHTVVEGGVLGDECGDMLRRFFVDRREQYRNRRVTPQTQPVRRRAAATDLDADDAAIPTGESSELDDGLLR